MEPIGDWPDALSDLTPEDRQKLILGAGVIAFGVAFGSALGQSAKLGSYMDEVKDEKMSGGQLVSTMVGAGISTAMLGGMISSAAKEYGWKNLLLYGAALSGGALAIRAVRNARA